MDVTPDAYLLETNARPHDAARPAAREPRGAYDPTGEVERGQFHLLFPGTVVNVMPGRPNFSIGPIVPRAPRRRTASSTTSSPQDADEAWIEESLAFDAQVGAEDRVLIERVQAGMRAGLDRRGPAPARSPSSSSRTSRRSSSTRSPERGDGLTPPVAHRRGVDVGLRSVEG